MSIASEIQRLQNAKSAIKSAIEGKGVTVPTATKLDGYAPLISAIPTVVDGNNLEYGLTDGTQPLVGVATVGYAEVE